MMKRIITMLLFAVALTTATTAEAQIKFGLKGGVNVTSMSFNNSVFDASNRTGFFVGPTVKIQLPLVGLGIDASALYDQREAKVRVADSFTGNTYTKEEFTNWLKQQYGIDFVGLSFRIALISFFRIYGKEVDFAKCIGVDALHPYLWLIDKILIDNAHKNGMTVNPWTVNKERDIKRLVELGVDGVITDVPNVAKKIIEEL